MIGKIDRIDFLIQRAVDAVLDLDFRVASFNVNVRGARFHRIVDDRVDQFDDRRHLAVGRQTIQIENFFARFRFPHQRNAKARSGFLQDALGGVAFAQHDIDRAGGGHVRHQPHAQRSGKIVQQIQVSWVRHSDVQFSVFAPEAR